ncbi:MAG: hypothetical protein A2445_01275 [Candidatus Jacksonbacteria bacterium RIFOXYC2_FULL_44_29]|nr:MAG: hypothetical protein UW45_C0013G0018 [Parcubacteria group bacterium GW2011_GWC2_44_22]OGY74968.1 MAG: hypothetical protein A2240_05305 [Candidatus Jacksonbacteria bacterium RIFOXYA2_FULL_43_12]OGY76521.1 MAG: hypothetical protein A2295_02090 [Candidatus Jacksonbacteria bacterium RIFOXYB2_FULL_44_15]OGY78501.1 MAG: hypothetical protein A2445_01275 [Candidatus Jacksonbacteria bacterium RIFOXYC2_FULL_44_29]OGY81158.1 MAG: hypothetical protein A2550_01670 [Candidatus Jacksonbacteria bacteri
MKHIKFIIIASFFLLLLPLGVEALDYNWKGPECTATTSGSSTVANVVTEVGCHCGQTSSTASTTGPTKIKCDSTKFICSTNNYNPNPFTICLYKIGQTPDSGITPEVSCEGGAMYDRNKKQCVVDTGETSLGGALGSSTNDIRNTIRRFINVALGFLGIITVVMVIYGGVMWLTAAGSDEKIEKGKRIITWAAIGAIVISIAWTISSYILEIGHSIG